MQGLYPGDVILEAQMDATAKTLRAQQAMTEAHEAQRRMGTLLEQQAKQERRQARGR